MTGPEPGTKRQGFGMRQLKGKVKESAREKKERKKEFMDNKERAFSVALPVLGVLFLSIVVFVYLNSRPKI